ncbi:UNVERIFIED_CONTAM: hypothetical protein GTU68_011784, partial [Idotea baltica]|nr:hypothetical protein [Idotea baltica]
CYFCGKIIHRPSKLVEHLRIHTGERPFPCPHCPYRATVKANLMRHVVTRHGSTPEL